MMTPLEAPYAVSKLLTGMKEMVTLNRKEQRRLVVLNQVETGKMIGREAAEVIDLSLRQVRRLLAAYRPR